MSWSYLKDYVLTRVPIKRRARFNVRTGRPYADPKTEADEKAVAGAYRGEKLEGAVRLEVHVYRALPKARPKGVRSEPDIIRPDLDNIVKAVMDGLNGVAYDDDRQVVEIHAYKHARVRKPGDSIRFSVREADEWI